MHGLSLLAADVEAAVEAPLSVVSAGNSANLGWGSRDWRHRPHRRPAPRRGDPPGPRPTDAPCGPGSADRRRRPGRRAHRGPGQAGAAVGRPRPGRLRGAVVPPAHRHGATRRPGGGSPGPRPGRPGAAGGLAVLGTSSDHLVVDLGDHGAVVGDELVFGVGYGGLLRAMTSPFVAVVECCQRAPRPPSRSSPRRRALGPVGRPRGTVDW